MHIPAGICWPVHRVAVGGHYPDGLDVIERRWTLEMVVNAYEVCDAIDDARAQAAERK